MQTHTMFIDQQYPNNNFKKICIKKIFLELAATFDLYTAIELSFIVVYNSYRYILTAITSVQ